MASSDVPAIFIYGEKNIRSSWPVEHVAHLMPEARFELIKWVVHVIVRRICPKHIFSSLRVCLLLTVGWQILFWYSEQEDRLTNPCLTSIVISKWHTSWNQTATVCWVNGTFTIANPPIYRRRGSLGDPLICLDQINSIVSSHEFSIGRYYFIRIVRENDLLSLNATPSGKPYSLLS